MEDEYTQITSLADLLPDAENANAGTDRGQWALKESVMRFGVGRGVLVDRRGRVIAGNKTRQTLAELGDDFKVVVVPSDGRTLVVTQRVDLDLDDPDAQELAIADNRVAELNLAWDAQEIAAKVEAGLDLAAFFHQDELDALLHQATQMEDEEEVAEEDEHDPVPEMEVQPFEHYDYVMVCFRSTWDWAQAMDVLGLEEQGFSFTAKDGKKHRKIGLSRVMDGRRFLQRIAALTGQIPAGEPETEVRASE